ncbi:M14 family metallopeptidase [Litorilituus lipolyticus]|uniref:Peptidase M14 domain-containing protein n=1 Tax=Litorilituus lipolyticus TaxID=2491017 RepID=A0A502KTI9_9GAMM|nr:M14 family metallopeptidase [Litorilituus lipolyticus]TPH13361.1 hypothetical protein EPA86_14315 [Litorilituus lipolyticus]
MLLLRLLIILSFFIFSSVVQASSITHYLPKSASYNQAIPLPSMSLGFEIGQRHIRHDQLSQYFYQLSTASSRVMLTSMGRTPQFREQLLVTISSPENLAKLPQLLAKNSNETKDTQKPLVVWLGYSVHGDEISGANAAMVVAYYLAASNETSIEQILQNTIIVLEPSINPDGMDRFVNWVTTYRNSSDNSDVNHIEHHQDWVTGRTNHFWFDLNRDWLLLSQQESRHRLAYYHQYQPHVVGDFHEMGHNSSYFFQPGIRSRNHPLTPADNYNLTAAMAEFHAKALDKQHRLYYSEENFDDFYFGKGSTYPDINGSIGILFEQASSRGMQQQTNNGLLTFEDSIKNHVLTSLSTIEGAWHHREALIQYKKDFYQSALKLAKKQKIAGYLLHEAHDSYRLSALLSKLQQHQISIYPLTEDYEYKDKLYSKEHSYFVPLAQPQYRLIQALFNQQSHFKDNTFYDVSGWTLPLAMNIEHQALRRTRGLSLSQQAWQPPATIITNEVNKQTYSYAFNWQNYLAPKLLNRLLAKGVKAKVATKAFTSVVDGKKQHFSKGSIVLLAGIQSIENWQDIVVNASNEVGIKLFNISTGLTPIGVDLGSSSFKVIKQPKVLLIGGQSISQYEAGEVRFYLDETLNIPVSVIKHNNLARRNISDYSHIIMVNGNYQHMSEKVTSKLKSWVKQGGVIIGQKRAATWLADNEILSAKIASKKQIDQLFDHQNLSYEDKEALAGRKRIAGAIFETELDTSHPLAFGYTSKSLALFRNSTLIIEHPQQPFITVAKYTPTPLLSGYTDQNLTNRLAHNAAIVAHNYGKGKVIATSDVLAFRGYWHGSAKLLANSIFFAHAFSASAK